MSWTVDAALPLWATAGFDAEHGRFEERLTFAAGRLPDVPLRLMSQARQIHSFALAARKGWYPGAAALVERAYASMVRDFHRRDGRGGWIFSIRRDGSVADSRRDLYAHAFVLLAIASYVEATGDRRGLILADETLCFIEQHMKAPAGGGFVEELPPAGGVRRQNPHMHLFEAVLALWECAGDGRHLRWAEELFALFASRFFRADPGIVGEYFTDALEPAVGVAGRIIEPGHHHEWVWLLRRFELAGGCAAQSYVDALYDYAHRHGFDDGGMIVDELVLDGPPRGTPAGGSHRIWPVAEAIRANLVEARRGRARAEGRAVALANLLGERFLKCECAGGWHDKVDRNGKCLSDFMPASSLYHLLGAVDELSRSAGRTLHRSP